MYRSKERKGKANESKIKAKFLSTRTKRLRKERKEKGKSATKGAALDGLAYSSRGKESGLLNTGEDSEVRLKAAELQGQEP